MLKYILKRLLQSVLTVLIIVSVVFLLMRMMPTDYFFTEDELIKLTESQKQSKLEAAGLLDPPLVQLQHFFQNMFKVDYIYATKQQALINTQLHSGVGEGVHSAVEGAINKYYTDAEAAAKEIDKINNKILTDNIISKQIDSALQGENGTDGAWVAEQLASNLSSKALGTLFKDAKKAIGEEQAGQLRDELDTTLRSKMSELLSGVDLEVNATGFKNILNHLVPSNYSFTFSLGESYRIRHGVSVIEIISDKFPISMRIGLCSLALALVLGVVLGILQVGFIGLLGLAAAFLLEMPRLPQSGGEWGMILMLALVCSCFGFTLQPVAQRYVSAERAGTFCALNPLTAASLGTVFLHERLGLWGLAGAALILTGILIQSLGERQRAPRLAKA